jgi:inhibitor of KinA sporulation pathway (predicted exonuclease)
MAFCIFGDLFLILQPIQCFIMNFIIFDLEATCWQTESERKGRTQEIIEIGAVKINEFGKTESRFESFVRPIIHPNLSDFCRSLTSITQVDVNRADTFPEVIADFQEWIGLNDEEEYLLCSWGFFDQRALSKNCLMHEIDDEWTKAHISLKHQYPRIKGLGYAPGLKHTVEKEGFEFEGAHHRGIDDALNLAKIFLKYQNQWQF